MKATALWCGFPEIEGKAQNELTWVATHCTVAKPNVPEEFLLVKDGVGRHVDRDEQIRVGV